MTKLKHYKIHYRLHGKPSAFRFRAFAKPSQTRLELEVLLHHMDTPRTVTMDAPWEEPIRSSESCRLAELGVTDVHLEQESCTY